MNNDTAEQERDHRQLQPPTVRARRPLGDGLVLGMAIGFAVWLPFMLFSARFLSSVVATLFASVVIGLLTSALLTLVTFLFRRRIAAALLGEVQLSVSAVTESVGAAIDAWPDRSRSAAAANVAARESVALAGWFMTRRTLTTVLLGMVGSVVAMVGTVLLLKQTQALEEQNKKLDMQTTLLERQNSIMASEGLWEHLWGAHYAANPEVRMNAAVEVASAHQTLSGVTLEGPAVTDTRFNLLREKPRFEDGEFDPTVVLAPIPARIQSAIGPRTFRDLESVVAASIEHSRLKNLTVDFGGLRRRDLRALSFEQCLVELSSGQQTDRVCFDDCSFDSSSVRLEAGQAALEGGSLRNTWLSSGLGQFSLRYCRLDGVVWNATWGRDVVRDSYGDALVLDYSGWAGREDARPSFQDCSFQNVVFVWDDREMTDVEGFLDRTIDSSAVVGRFYFVRAESSGERPALVILRDPSSRANEWNTKRRCR